MKRTILVAITLLATIWISTMGIAQSGPDKINLKEFYKITGKKEAVIFPHKLHQEKMACTDCHISEKGGPLKIKIEKVTGMGNDFHKKFCWPCHVEQKVPKGKACGLCHKKS